MNGCWSAPTSTSEISSPIPSTSMVSHSSTLFTAESYPLLLARMAWEYFHSKGREVSGIPCLPTCPENENPRTKKPVPAPYVGKWILAAIYEAAISCQHATVFLAPLAPVIRRQGGRRTNIPSACRLHTAEPIRDDGHRWVLSERRLIEGNVPTTKPGKSGRHWARSSPG